VKAQWCGIFAYNFMRKKKEDNTIKDLEHRIACLEYYLSQVNVKILVVSPISNQSGYGTYLDTTYCPICRSANANQHFHPTK
jgi:phosphopantetheine adenylyltransferase